MPNILLKKTFKSKPSGFKVANEKGFSFHGHITEDLITAINLRLSRIRTRSGANNLQFSLDTFGHYSTQMNHEYQKYHEEDAVVTILDVMEEYGYNFKFQYDQEIYSEKLSGSSFTKREVFVFNKTP